MKTIYYVIEKQLDSQDGYEEANGWKTVRTYEIKNDKLVQVAEDLEIPNIANTEIKIAEHLEKEAVISTRVNLIKL